MYVKFGANIQIIELISYFLCILFNLYFFWIVVSNALSYIMIKAVKPVLKSFLLGAGKHIVEVIEATPVFSQELVTPEGEMPKWVDKTPQVKVVMRNAVGQTTYWMNLTAFKSIKDFTDGVAPEGFTFRSFNDTSEKFLVDLATNKRVECPEGHERLEVVAGIFGNFAASLGFTDEDGDIEIDEILSTAVGRKIGVNVKERINNGKSYLEVASVMPAERVKPEVEA